MDRQLDEEALFHQARQLEPGEVREAYLRQACGDNAALRDRVQVLLAAHEQEKRFLAAPAPKGIGTVDEAPGAEASPLAEGPGTRIGPYKLLQQLGVGGMGVVYLAEQEQPVRRRVALKVIKAGMDSAQVIGRFEQERQALA